MQHAGRPLLPNEPRVENREEQQALTDRFLQSARPELESFLLVLRSRIDAQLQRLQPEKQGKPYPSGQCLEITQAVQRHLEQLDPRSFAGPSRLGCDALRQFQENGGSLRQVWGDLRGEYFQNAFLAGTLYLDVANDTVVPTKPKIEILPFAESGLIPIADYRHFSRLAIRYWKGLIFPNHLIPGLAAFFPLLSIVPDGRVRFQSSAEYMFALTLERAFQPSADVLEAAPLRQDLFDFLARLLAKAVPGTARDAVSGREMALRACRQFRREGRQHDAAYGNAAIETLEKANESLAGIHIQVG